MQPVPSSSRRSSITIVDAADCGWPRLLITYYYVPQKHRRRLYWLPFQLNGWREVINVPWWLDMWCCKDESRQNLTNGAEVGLYVWTWMDLQGKVQLLEKRSVWGVLIVNWKRARQSHDICQAAITDKNTSLQSVKTDMRTTSDANNFNAQQMTRMLNEDTVTGDSQKRRQMPWDVAICSLLIYSRTIQSLVEFHLCHVYVVSFPATTLVSASLTRHRNWRD